MARAPTNTAAEVFAAAERLAAKDEDVTPTALREALGGDSFSTLIKHIAAWKQARQVAPAQVILDMPESVRAAFAQCWQTAAAEAGKEIAAIRDKADAETKAMTRQLSDAIAAIEQLEAQADAETARHEEQLAAVTQKLETTVERERATITEAATAKAEAQRLTTQLHEQKSWSMDVIGKLEKSKQAWEAELNDLRKETREQVVALSRAQGELTALRAQVASQAEVIKQFRPNPTKPG